MASWLAQKRALLERLFRTQSRAPALRARSAELYEQAQELHQRAGELIAQTETVVAVSECLIEKSRRIAWTTKDRLIMCTDIERLDSVREVAIVACDSPIWTGVFRDAHIAEKEIERLRRLFAA